MAYTKVIDKGYNRFLKEIEAANRAFVTVGIHQGEKSKEGETIAEYAAYNEYGTEDIPSRPFMRTAFDENEVKLAKKMGDIPLKIAKGSSVDRELRLIGELHQSQIQSTISNRDFLPKLADSTVKAKKGSTKTLIDTGAMKNSVRYVVHK